MVERFYLVILPVLFFLGVLSLVAVVGTRRGWFFNSKGNLISNLRTCSWVQCGISALSHDVSFSYHAGYMKAVIGLTDCADTRLEYSSNPSSICSFPLLICLPQRQLRWSLFRKSCARTWGILCMYHKCLNCDNGMSMSGLLLSLISDDVLSAHNW